jgi:hypothetical protein
VPCRVCPGLFVGSADRIPIPEPRGSVHGVLGHQFQSTSLVKDYDTTVDRLGELFGLRVLEFSEVDRIPVN